MTEKKDICSANFEQDTKQTKLVGLVQEVVQQLYCLNIERLRTGWVYSWLIVKWQRSFLPSHILLLLDSFHALLNASVSWFQIKLPTLLTKRRWTDFSLQECITGHTWWLCSPCRWHEAGTYPDTLHTLWAEEEPVDKERERQPQKFDESVKRHFEQMENVPTKHMQSVQVVR